MNANFELQIDELISRAIFHELTCNCDLHQKHPRLNAQELHIIKNMFKNQSGFAFILGIVSALCVENPSVLLNHLKCINDWTEKGVPF